MSPGLSRVQQSALRPCANDLGMRGMHARCRPWSPQSIPSADPPGHHLPAIGKVGDAILGDRMCRVTRASRVFLLTADSTPRQDTAQSGS